MEALNLKLLEIENTDGYETFNSSERFQFFSYDFGTSLMNQSYYEHWYTDEKVNETSREATMTIDEALDVCPFAHKDGDYTFTFNNGIKLYYYGDTHQWRINKILSNNRVIRLKNTIKIILECAWYNSLRVVGKTIKLYKDDHADDPYNTEIIE